MAARMLQVLAAYDADQPRLALTPLVSRADLPLSTTHRLVAELVAWGALARRPDGRYEVGRRLWNLGLLAPVSLRLPDVALPFLQDSVPRPARTPTWPCATSALYIERIAGRSAVAIISRSGSRLPLHPTGVGQCAARSRPRRGRAQTAEEMNARRARSRSPCATSTGRSSRPWGSSSARHGGT